MRRCLRKHLDRGVSPQSHKDTEKGESRKFLIRPFSVSLCLCGDTTLPKIILLMVIALASCSRPQSERTTVHVAVGGQTQFIYLPLTLADQLGYFKDEGLSVQISDLRGGSEALAALIGGSVDMVTGFYEHTICARAHGKHLVMVSLFDRYPGMVLMLGKQHFNEVHSIKELVGKPVGVTAPGSSTDQLVKYILRQNNLDPQSIPVVTGG